MARAPSSPDGRILVVDDDPAHARALAEIISAQHEGCVWVDSAPKALEYAVFGAFELVLTDLHMPEVDGLELLRALTGLEAELPVILLSERGELDVATQVVRAGAFDFLWKPVEPARVLEAVERALRARAEAVDSRERELDSRERLERRSALLSVLFEQGSDGVLTWDERGRLVDISPSALALTGVSLEQVLAGGSKELFERGPFGRSLDELMPELVAELVAREGERLSHEVVVRTREGPAPARLLLDLCELPAREGGGPPARWVMGLLQPRHERLGERLRRADSLSSAAMIAVVSAHEIKNDLGPLLTYLSLLEELGPDEPDLVELLGAAQSSVRRAGQLIERILAPLRPERGPRREVEVAELTRTCVDFVKRSRRELRPRIELQLEPGLRPIRAWPDDIHQIVMNLVCNACDAVERARREGLDIGSEQPEVRVSLRERPADGRLVLEVHDCGPGIEPANRGRVFEPFFTTKVGKGTGLGLTVVRDLVRELGAELSIESAPSIRGTCVRVCFAARGTPSSGDL